MLPEFRGFGKITRLSRPCIVTEKIDGTNAQVYITDDGEVFAGSRNRWITPDDDNFGFAAWVQEHRTELLTLGSGRHFGEWWGQGIQRGYGLTEKRFSLFNIGRWMSDLPACCHTVPLLNQGSFDDSRVWQYALNLLHTDGSRAAPGFMKPEGIVICHIQSNVMFKKTFAHDQEGKGQ